MSGEISVNGPAHVSGLWAAYEIQTVSGEQLVAGVINGGDRSIDEPDEGTSISIHTAGGTQELKVRPPIRGQEQLIKEIARFAAFVTEPGTA